MAFPFCRKAEDYQGDNHPLGARDDRVGASLLLKYWTHRFLKRPFDRRSAETFVRRFVAPFQGDMVVLGFHEFCSVLDQISRQCARS